MNLYIYYRNSAKKIIFKKKILYGKKIKLLIAIERIEIIYLDLFLYISTIYATHKNRYISYLYKAIINE